MIAGARYIQDGEEGQVFEVSFGHVSIAASVGTDNYLNFRTILFQRISYTPSSTSSHTLPEINPYDTVVAVDSGSSCHYNTVHFSSGA